MGGYFNMFRQKTPGGYDFGECVSALQKSIRAGSPRDAMYWAVEIEATGSQARKYLWNRLRVIASEDIGPTLEGNQVALLIPVLSENFHDAVTRSNDSYRLFLAHAMIAMCSVPKTRICDDMVWAVYHEDGTRPIPDNAIDMHTPRGRKMGRGDEFWYAHCVQVTPTTDRFQPLADELDADARRYSAEDRPWRYAKDAKKVDDDPGERLL